MIDRLEEAGLVERRRDESDRRAWRIHLTEAATPVLRKLEKMGEAFNADMLAGIPDAERETVLRVLQRMRDNLEQTEARAGNCVMRDANPRIEIDDKPVPAKPA